MATLPNETVRRAVQAFFYFDYQLDTTTSVIITLSARQAESIKAPSGLVDVIEMYVPIAFYKNNLVLIDNMDTFALYYCSSVKQKMRPTLGEGIDNGKDGRMSAETDDGFGGSAYALEESFSDTLDDDEL